MSEHIDRLRAFTKFLESGRGVMSAELEDGVKLLRDYDALAARLAEATAFGVECQKSLETDRARLAEAERDLDRFERLWNAACEFLTFDQLCYIDKPHQYPQHAPKRAPASAPAVHTCGCVKKCEPELLQPGEVCVNTLTVDAGEVPK